jgi:uncharacterized protein (TIGR03083 family)
MSAHPSIAGTRLSSSAYADHLAADHAAMLAAASDLDAAVPGCPGWTTRDLLSHVVGVYRHKSTALETGSAPPEGQGPWGEIAEGVDVREVLRAEYERLRELLTADEAAPAWSWWPAEQTVGFWQRRMAQETAVHRWDAESAAHGVDGAGAIAEELAADGVDEILGWLAWPWDELPQPEAAGQRVLVSSGEHSWTVTLTPTRVDVVGGSGEAEALVAADPSGLLLHLWGRPGEHGVATGGDDTALRLFRERLAMLGD